MFYSTTSFLQNLSLCAWHIFLFPSFCWSTWILSVQLSHFHKIINKPSTSISKNHNLVQQKYHLV